MAERKESRLFRQASKLRAASSRGAEKLRFPYLVAIALFIVFTAPSVTYQLPNYRSNLSEEYQPLQTFKFFATEGKAFHKYGPMENFLLALPYAATLGYWKLTGGMGHFSASYPFGFKDPLRQFGALHLEGRILFLLLSIVAFYFFCRRLEAISDNRLIVTAAFLVCIGTNVPLLEDAVAPAPDSAMNFFSAAALGLYVGIVVAGLNPLRAFCLSLLALFAVTAKELAAAMFVLPYIGLLWAQSRGARSPEARSNLVKSGLVLTGTGAAGYALLNIIYAPHTWLERMSFWLRGPGIDRAVWGDTTLVERIEGIALCMLDNLGPGGTVLVLASLVFFFARRPAHWLLLSLPTLSLFCFGIARLGYQEDRFFTLAAISLCPMMVAGLDGCAKELRGTKVFDLIAAAAALLIFINIFYGSAAWLFLEQKSDTLMEKEVRARACGRARVWVFSMFSQPEASRYTMLGYTFDGRSASQVMKSSVEQLPQVAMSTLGELQFIEDARSRPARARMIKSESGFDVAEWRGMEALGYPQVFTVIPQFPRWFCFGWMPTVKTFVFRNTVLVYSRPCAADRSAMR